MPATLALKIYDPHRDSGTMTIPRGSYRIFFNIPVHLPVSTTTTILNKKIGNVTINRVEARPAADQIVVTVHVDDRITVNNGVASTQSADQILNLLQVQKIERVLIPRWAMFVILWLLIFFTPLKQKVLGKWL